MTKKLEVPEAVRAALDQAERADLKQRRAERTAREKENERLREIAEYRLSRGAELQKAAQAVFAWRESFVATPESSRIWDRIGDKQRLTLYIAKFWRGEPATPGDRTSWAVLAFEGWRAGAFGLPPFWYMERFKGHTSFEQRIISPQDLVDATHPDFLAGCAAHLAGPEAWKWVLLDLQRGTPR